MANANIVSVTRNPINLAVTIAVSVLEAGDAARTEYTATIPASALDNLSPAQQKAVLVAAVKAVRDSDPRTQQGLSVLPINGTVTI